MVIDRSIRNQKMIAIFILAKRDNVARTDIDEFRFEANDLLTFAMEAKAFGFWSLHFLLISNVAIKYANLY